MEAPILFWVDMHGAAGAAEPPREFSRHFDTRLIDRAHLWTTMRVAARADLICLNFDHPDIDGLQFAAGTKTQFPSTPIIMLICEQSTEIVLWALRSRIFDVLIKPVTAQESLRLMQRLAPIPSAKRAQSSRANITTSASIPSEARYRLHNHARHKLAAVLEYISKHYASPIAEREIAQMCGMSPFNFSRAFRAAYQTTFRDYLMDHRLKQSKRLLANRSVPITDVAAMSGFNDPSYFARLFKRRLGASPTTYRMSLSNAMSPAATAESGWEKANGG